jgi:lipid-binding SYLF domain-containing protein
MRILAAVLLLSSSLVAAENETARRLGEAADVFTEIMAARDRDIPQDLLEKAHCVVIIPGMKNAAFIVGAKYGKGFLICREREGRSWSAPAAVRVEGGSVGLQIGGSETDVVMLVMNERGAEKLLSSRFTLGGEGEVAAGPVGRSTTAQTDAWMTAEILSWSRSHGVFAGVSLQGATLRQDTDDNEALYGKRLDNRDIVRGAIAPPPAAGRLLSLLKRYSARERS